MIISCITHSTARAFARLRSPPTGSGVADLAGSIVAVTVVLLVTGTDKNDLNR
jgi:hypothetical protein